MNEVKQSWREIDTSTDEGKRQLNRAVAEAVGYRLEPQHVRQREGEPPSFTYMVVQPNGAKHYLIGFHASEESAWNLVQHLSIIPDYVNDLNAAEGLLDSTPGVLWSVTRHKDYGYLVYEVLGTNENGEAVIVEEHADKRIARCHAFLAWKEMQDGS